MPLDILGAMQDASRTGIALGSAISNDNYRMQELKSQRARQQFQERQTAQRMALLMEKHDLEVQERADMAKAAARFEVLTSPFIPTQMPIQGPPTADGPGELGSAMVPVPNKDRMLPEDAFMQTIAPIQMKYNPNKGLDILADYSRVKKERIDRQFQPHAEPIIMPNGEVMQGIRSSPNNWTPVGTGGPETKVENGRMFRRDRFGAWIPMTASSEDIGKRQTAQKLLAEALKLDASKVRMDEDGNAIITPEVWREISAKGAVAPATRNAIEKQILATDTTIAGAEEALRVIQDVPEALGVPGMARELGETAKGLAGIPQDPRISVARDKLTQAFTRIADDLKVDSGNLSLYERKKLEDAGDPTKWNQYKERTEPKMQSLINAAIAKRIRLKSQIGQVPSDQEIGRIQFSEIQGMYDSGVIDDTTLKRLVQMKRLTGDQAIEIYNNRPKG